MPVIFSGGKSCLSAGNKEGTMESTFNVLGIRIKVKEVPVVDKYESSLGRYDPLTNTITLDESLPKDLKGQVLMHELLHAICHLTGQYDIYEDETAIQSLSTALYYLFKNNQF